MSKYEVDITNYDNFKTVTIGKLFDVDGIYGAQCWDASALLWSQPPMARTLRSSNGSALGCWDSSVRQINAGTEFDIITDVTKIKRGDVIVFGTGLGSYGHMGFADIDYSSDSIVCYSQNQGGSNGQGQAAAFSVKTYASRHLIGAYRFKKWNTTSSSENSTVSSVTSKIKIGDIVQFTGGNVFISSTITSPAGNKNASRCKVTNMNISGRNPYHLISEDKGGVYGWVTVDAIKEIIQSGVYLPYMVRINKGVNYRKGAGMDYSVTGTVTDNGIYTIVDELNGFGKLKSGAGWVSLTSVQKI